MPARPGSPPPSDGDALDHGIPDAVARPRARRRRAALSIAAHQGAEHEDAVSDAEPGKILHEMRFGEMAALGEVPFRRYYGTNRRDAPLRHAGRRLSRAYGRRSATIRTLLPAIDRAVGWIDAYGDRDGDGFVEYGRQHAVKGCRIRAGRTATTPSSTRTAASRRARSPCARCRPMFYGAKRAARGYRGAASVDEARAAALAGQAQALAGRFADAFWCLRSRHLCPRPLDGEKRPCRVRAVERRSRAPRPGSPTTRSTPTSWRAR